MITQEETPVKQTSRQAATTNSNSGQQTDVTG